MKTKLTILILLTTIIFNIKTISQGWNNSSIVDGNTISPIFSAIDDNDNNYVLCEFIDTMFTAVGDFGSISSTKDIALLKFNTTGTLEWVISVGSTANDIPGGVSVDESGNVYFSGSFQNTANFSTGHTLVSNGGFDFFVAKVDPSGNLLWRKTLGTSTIVTNSHQLSSNLAVYKNSSLVLTGLFSSTLTIGESAADDSTITAGATFKFFVADFDTSGKLDWVKGVQGTNNGTRLNNIAVDDSGYYIGGDFIGDLQFDIRTISSDGSNKDCFVYKLLHDGTSKWVRQILGSNIETFRGITTDANNSVYFLGNFQSTTLTIDSTKTLTASPYTRAETDIDTYIGKYNKSGVLLWYLIKGGKSKDIYLDFEIKENILYASGYFTDTLQFNNDVLTSSSPTDQDAFIAAFNSIGDPISGASIQGNQDANDRASVIQINKNVGAQVFGYFTEDTIDIGSDTHINFRSGEQSLFYAVYSHPFTAVVTDEENPSCKDAADGSLTITPYFGVGPYTFLWSNGQTDSVAIDLADGTYQVTITDSRDSTAVGEGTINEPSNINLSFAGTSVSCYKGFDGSIDLTVSGGNGGYSYVWSGGTGLNPVLQDQSGLSAATYSVTVTDSKSCQQIGDTTLTEPSEIFINPDTTTVTTVGGSDGAIDLSVFGGTPSYTYNWTGPSSYTSTSEDITGIIKGTYYITVTDNNSCTKDSAIVVEEPGFIAYISTKKDVSCKGAGDGQAAVTVENGDGTFPNQYSFVWKDSTGTTVGSGAALSSLSGGKYYVTVTDIVTPSNIDSTSVVIGEPSSALSVTELPTQPSCHGESDAYINLIVSGGTPLYEFIWSTSDTTEDLTNIPSSETPYSYTITDQNDCQKTGSLLISQDDSISLNITPSNPTCPGTLTGSATALASGGTGFFSYKWNDDGLQTEAAATALKAGTYTVTVTDFSNCTKSKSVTLIDPTPVSILGIQPYDASCNSFADGAVKVTATGGSGSYNYTWNPSAPNSDSISGLLANTYYVTVNDVNDCTPQTTSAIVNEPTVILIDVDTTNVTCFGFADGSIAVSASGGTNSFTYDWSNGDNAATTNNLAAGNYSVTISDGSCPDSVYTDIPITQPTEIIIDIDTTHLLCNGDGNGKIKLSVTGGSESYVYNWSTGSDKDSIFNLNGGAYHVTISDGSCPDTMLNNITVDEPNAISLLSINATNVSCFGSSDGTVKVNITGGTAPYDYTWNPSAPNSDSIYGLGSATYNVTVTDNNNCTPVTTSANVTQPLEITIDIDTTDISCFGFADGSIAVSASGGTNSFTYDWSNGDNAATTNNLAVGNYSVTISDGSCPDSVYTDIPITQPAEINIDIDTTHLLCNGDGNGKIKLSVTGGSQSYTYNWSTGSDKDSIFNLNGGAYHVTISDGSCPDTTLNDIAVDEPDSVYINNVITSDISCFGINDGSIEAIAAGGSGEYNYSWSHSSDNVSIVDSLSSGNYSVTISNVLCVNDTIFAQTFISEPTEISISDIIKTDASSSSAEDGTIQIVASGGSGTLKYALDDGAYQTSNLFENLLSKTYAIKVTDDNNCGPITDEAIIDHPSAINLTYANNFNIYPNPVNDYFYITFKNSLNGNFYLVNVLGQKIIPDTENITNSKTRVIIKNIPEGYYYVFLDNNVIGKIIVNK